MIVEERIARRLSYLGSIKVLPLLKRDPLKTGDFFFGRCKIGSENLVVKLANPASRSAITRLQNEIEILQRVQCSSVIEYKGSDFYNYKFLDGTKQRTVYLLTKQARGDIYRLNSVVKKIPIRTKIKLCQKLLYTVQHFHQVGICHTDLTPLNTLIIGNSLRPSLKICDFADATPKNDMIVLRGSYFHPQIKLTAMQADYWGVLSIVRWLLLGATPSEAPRSINLPGFNSEECFWLGIVPSLTVPIEKQYKALERILKI